MSRSKSSTNPTGGSCQREASSHFLEIRPSAQQETTESSAGMKRPTEPSMHRKTSMPITVAIVGKDPVVSRAIESLLQTAGKEKQTLEQEIAQLGTGLEAANNELAQVEQQIQQTEQQILAANEELAQLDQQIAELNKRSELAGCV
jgi:peptidoglycan hydrolase CwlO-like protein